MRRLAPMFVITSIVALAGSNALAMGDHVKSKSSKTASTVTASASPTGQSTSGSPAGSVGSTGGTGTTLGYTAGDGAKSAMNDAETKPTASMNDAETKPTASMNDSPAAKPSAKAKKRHVASNADKGSSSSGSGK
ncbi:MAG TPA: hypothetical protein VN598_19710 [Usitatibacter sp.]|nr:hypothetical protein [Usitatibacter sp.]